MAELDPEIDWHLGEAAIPKADRAVTLPRISRKKLSGSLADWWSKPLW